MKCFYSFTAYLGFFASVLPFPAEANGLKTLRERPIGIDCKVLQVYAQVYAALGCLEYMPAVKEFDYLNSGKAKKRRTESRGYCSGVAMPKFKINMLKMLSISIPTFPFFK